MLAARAGLLFVAGALMPMALLGFASIASAATTATSLAQPSTAMPEVVKSLDLAAAIAQARSESRLLLLELAPGTTRNGAIAERWSSPILKAWAKRHALVVRVSDIPTIKLLQEQGLTQASDGDPLLFKDGKYVRGFSIAANWSTQNDENNQPVRVYASKQISRIPRAPRGTAADVALMLRLDWTWRSFETSDPAFFAAHVKSAAERAKAVKPGDTSFSMREEAGVTPFMVSVPMGEAGERVILDALTQVRAWAKSDKPEDLAKATGGYTSIWELTDVAGSNFDSGRLCIIAAEMHALAARYAPAKARFKAMFEAQMTAVDTADAKRLFSVLTLARIADVHVPVYEFFDNALNDPDAATMMPRAERLNLESMLPRLHFNDPLSETKQPITILERHAKIITGKPPRTLPTEAHAKAVEFRKWLMLVDAGRVVATLRVAGRDDDAKAARELTNKTLGESAAVKRTLELTDLLAPHTKK
jgi:hypothetical protein